MAPNIPKAGAIVDKVISKTDIIGALSGFYSYNGSWDAIVGNIGAVMTNPLPTNIPNLIGNMKSIVLSNLPLVLGGMLVEYVDEPSLNKYAHAVMKFGVGSIMGGALAAFIANSHNPGPITGSSGGSMAPATDQVWTQRTGTGGITTNAQNVKYASSSEVMLPVK